MTMLSPSDWIQNANQNDLVTCLINRFKLEIDPDLTYRQSKLMILKMILNGTIYKNLKPWWSEYEGMGKKYVPLIERSPSVVYGLPKIVVDGSTSMLFGSNHFPAIRCEDEESEKFFQMITRKHSLNYAMLSSSRMGSLGSVCIVVKVVNGKFCFEAIETDHLNPVFSSTDPTKLSNLTEIKKTYGEVLLSKGYDINEEDLKKQFYIMREWTEEEEFYYMPVLVDKCESISKIPKKIDPKRSVAHEFGFIPAVWIKNTPEYSNVDGKCSFESIIYEAFEIDYQLSQLGRALRYNMDPLMVIKDPSQVMEGQQFSKGGGRALTVGEGGDAFLLEMSNQSTQAVIDYVRCIREFSLETARGNRSNPDKISSIHSGKALQMLNNPLVSFVEELRLCYGENGLLPLYEIVAKIASGNKYILDYKGYKIGDLDKTLNTMNLDWPDWYPPTPQDDLQEAQTLQVLLGTGIISQETAMQSVAEKFNIVDVDKELTDVIKNDRTQQVTDDLISKPATQSPTIKVEND